MARPVKNVAFDMAVGLLKNDGTLIANPGTVTAKISKDFGDWADVGTVSEEDSTYSQIKLALTSTEMNAESIDYYVVDNTAGCVPVRGTIYTEAAPLTAAGIASTVVTAISDLATYGLVALNTLLVTTGIKVATNADKTGYALASTVVTCADATAAKDDLANATDGLGALKTLIDAIPTNPYTGTPPTADVIGTDAAAKVWGTAVKAVTAIPAVTGATLHADYDSAKDDVLTPLGVVDGIVDSIAAEIAAFASTDDVDALIDAAIAAAALATAAGQNSIIERTDRIPDVPMAAGDVTVAGFATGVQAALAAAIEAVMVNETDTTHLLQAVVDKFAAAFPDIDEVTLSAFAAAMRADIERVGGLLAETKASADAANRTTPPSIDDLPTNAELGIAIAGLSQVQAAPDISDLATRAEVLALSPVLPAAPLDMTPVTDAIEAIPAPTFTGTVTFDGTVNNDVTVNPTTLDGGERAAIAAAAIAAGVATELNATANKDAVLEAVTEGTITSGVEFTDESEDADGNVIGITTPGATIRAYAAVADPALTAALRKSTAEANGTWSIYVEPGLPANANGATHILGFTKDGYYDAEGGDSVLTAEVTA
jgi:hypothetical protein